jgi:NAD(P)H-hydrate epimerase
LTGDSVNDILDKGVLAPQSFAEQMGVSVLLKNAVSVLSDGTRTWVNTAGTVGQAKGGSGDVLSGVIAGLCACGLSAFDGAAAGAWLCGRAAEIAVQETGEYSLLPTDVIDKLGKAFLYATENTDSQSAQE